MKKTYTKKQIQEAIFYWQKQLNSGNYRKVVESIEYETVYERIGGELAERDDIPNYLKGYIREEVLQGYDDEDDDGEPYWDLNEYVEELLDTREIVVDLADGNTTDIPSRDLPLKVTFQQIVDYINEHVQSIGVIGVAIKFQSPMAFRPGQYIMQYYYVPGKFNNNKLRRETYNKGLNLIDLHDDGDPTEYNGYKNTVYTIAEYGK